MKAPAGRCGSRAELVRSAVGKRFRQLTFDLGERGEQLQVLFRLGAPGDGVRDRRRQRRIGGGLLAGAEDHLPAGLVHRHGPFHDRDDRAAHAGRHREDGAFDRGDRITGQDAQVAAALLGGLDDDVAALEVNGAAAPGGGDEQLRALVDVHRSIRRRAAARRAPRGRCGPSRLRQSTAPALRASPGRRYRPPSADTTVARGPPGAIMASMVPRPRYRTERTSAAAAARLPSASSGRRSAAAWRPRGGRPSSRPARRGTRGSG